MYVGAIISQTRYARLPIGVLPSFESHATCHRGNAAMLVCQSWYLNRECGQCEQASRCFIAGQLQQFASGLEVVQLTRLEA